MATNPFNLATPQPVETVFLANNGNPNTVYNTAASPFAIRSTGSQPIPVSVPGTLPSLPAVRAMPQNSAYANQATQFWRNLSPITPFQFELGDVWGASGAGWGSPSPPNTPATTPPPTTPNPFTPPNVVDRPTTGAGEVDLGRPGGSVTPPSGWTNTITDRNGASWNMPDYNSMSNMLQDSIRNIAEAFGANGFDEGRFDFNQFVDAISEPFLQGNLYNENVGSWNGLNILEAIVDALVPGVATGFGSKLSSLVERMFPNSKFAQWVRTRVVQNNVDDAKDRDSYMDAPQDRGGRENYGSGGGGLGGAGGASWGSGVTGGGGGSLRTNVTVRPPENIA